MGNWVGTSRTNYFGVKDVSTFLLAMALYEVEVITRDGDSKVGLIARTDSGDWPSNLGWTQPADDLAELALVVAGDRNLKAPIDTDTAKELIEAALAAADNPPVVASWERNLALQLITSTEYLEGSEDVEADFIDTVSAFLGDGEVAVFQTIGHERTRYLCGYSVAINDAGERVEVGLDEIYEKAKAQFGVEPSRAEY